jgi:hypothetical protein
VTGAYNVSFEFRHNLQEISEQQNASWGFNLKAAIADGNPNYVKSSLLAGIEAFYNYAVAPSWRDSIL